MWVTMSEVGMCFHACRGHRTNLGVVSHLPHCLRKSLSFITTYGRVSGPLFPGYDLSPPPVSE